MSTKKVTFGTLKKYARQGILTHRIRQSFDGMVDGMSKHESVDLFSKTSLKDLERFKVTKNHISYIPERDIYKLYNGVFIVDFKLRALKK